MTFPKCLNLASSNSLFVFYSKNNMIVFKFKTHLFAINHSKFFSCSLHFTVHADLGPTIVVTLTEELQKAEEVTSELIVSHDLLTYVKGRKYMETHHTYVNMSL